MNDWRDAVESIRTQADLVSIIGETTSLKRNGQRFTGLCPFHQEKTPSFYVDPRKGFYKCFGCGKGGDIFSFVMEIRSLTFPESVRLLGEKCGVEVPEHKETQEQKQQRDFDKEAESILKLASNWYVQVFQKSSTAAEAREYWQSRAFELQHAQQFGVGFSPSPNELVDFLRKKKASLELAAKYGLLHLNRGQYSDRYWGRIVFSIFDHRERCVGFGSRVFRDGPSAGHPEAKYVNTPDTPLFRKSQILYGLNWAWKSKSTESLHLTEGYFDVLRMLVTGHPAAAAMGTAFNEQHLPRIRGQKSITLAFDGDNAGIAAAQKAFPLIVNSGIECRVSMLGEKDDLDSHVLSTGTLPESMPALEWFIERTLQNSSGTIQDAQRVHDSLSEMAEQLQSDVVRQAFVEACNAKGAAIHVKQSGSRPVQQAPPAQVRPAEPPRQSQQMPLWQQQLVLAAHNQIRKQQLQDNEVFEILPVQVQEFLEGRNPLPEHLAEKVSPDLISDQDWSNLLHTARVETERLSAKRREKILLKAIQTETLSGNTERVEELMIQLSQIKETR